MAKTRQQKQEAFNQFLRLLEKGQAIVFSTFSKVNIKTLQEIRSQLKSSGISYTVIKKTLVKRALKEKGITENFVDTWMGNIAAAVSMDDEVAPAKILVGVSKEVAGLKVQGGILAGKLVDASTISELAGLPTRENLIARAVGAIRAPLIGLVNVIHGNQRNFIYVLQQIKESKN